MKTKPMPRKLKYRFSYLIGLLILASISIANVKAEEITRDYKGSLNVSADDLLSLKTSHCRDMNITTTDDNKVSYKVTLIVTVDKDSKSMANDMLNEIEFDLNQSNGSVNIDLGWPFRSFSSTSKLFGSASTKVSMQNGKTFNFPDKISVIMKAEVSIPKNNILELDAKHSKMFLGHLSNTADIDIGHSTLNMNDVKSMKVDASHSTVEVGNVSEGSKIKLSHSKVKGLKFNNIEAHLSHSRIATIDGQNISLSLSHSKADIDKCKNAVLSSVSHSDLELNQVQAVKINSTQHSTIEIDKADNVKVNNGQHGKIAVKETNSFEFESGGFTQIYVGKVNKSLEIDTQHSNVTIDELGANINEFEIENEFASVSIGTQNIPNMDVLIDDVEHTTINAGSEIKKKSAGYYTKRSGSGNPIEIKLDCGRCTINLK